MSEVKSSGRHHFAHHFKTAFHEFDACKVGMWLFLLQEVLFFSPLFVGYSIFRALYHEAWHEASHLLDWKLGGLNTLILISSSFTMALAVRAAQNGDRKKIVVNLAITIACAIGFLVVKYFEYAHKFHLGLLPAGMFTYQGLTHPKATLFFSLYFVMTGLHGLHVLIGIGLLAWILIRARRGDFDEGYFTPVELTGLYWHFVDLVWIYIFPLLYLVG